EDEEGRVEDELRQEDGPEQRMAEHERGPFSKVLEGVSRREARPSRLAQIGEQEHRAARQRRGQGEGGSGARPAHQHARPGAVWSRPVPPAPAPRLSTATMGAAARPTCSADWAARLDQASRLKAAGSRGPDLERMDAGIVAGMVVDPPR